jgi:ADP-dependent NAD(P)H-hydrate dehydratase / NAD(P)H-hydrate epimerase
MRILDSNQMREADRRTIEDRGIPASALMENAGAASADAIDSIYGSPVDRRVFVLAGRGNNGGDGFVIARVLAERGALVTVLIVGGRSGIRAEALEKLDALDELGLEAQEVLTDDDWRAVRKDVVDADLVVDAIVGTGFRPPLRGVAATIADDLARSAVPVVAIDLPSGLSADTADVPGPAVKATVTVALAALKLPLVQTPAAAFAGRIVVVDIGIPRDVIEGIGGTRMMAMTREDARRLIPKRKVDSHKGEYGHVLVVAGSRGKTGAAVLTARAALRSGAGLVTIAAPASLAPLMIARDPEIMTLELPESADGTVRESAADVVSRFDADVIVAGPGLGQGLDVQAFVRELLRVDKPLVLDADALNALAVMPGYLSRRGGETILTPHPGEMARLSSSTTAEIQARRIDVARDFGVANRAHVVLKGHRTVVASPDGRVSLNFTGNPGMATAGAGDVLAGVIAAWRAQLGDPERAARLGVYVHGMAGDLAAKEVGQEALIASDIIGHLGPAVVALSEPPDEGLHW